MKKRNILYISMSIPYDNIPHAGGKTFNFYINSFTENEDNSVTLIAKVLPDEENEIDKINQKIRTLLVCTPKNKFIKFVSYLKSINSKFNPLYPYGNVLTKEIYDQILNRLKQLKEENYYPDVVILEWTWMLLFIDKVKKIFPDAIYVASEHDVSFLGCERTYNHSSGIRKLYRYLYYKNIKNRELYCINKCDLVVTHNNKDRLLLLNNNINNNKLGVIVPYFNIPNIVERFNITHDIIFYGAMNRLENEQSAIWFIERVLPLLQDVDIRFIIIGNHPSDKLKKYRNDKIIITGFVDDISTFFSEALCFVAPLQDGAGVKVKILEAMARGVPVLTNSIGIEGIDARPTLEYLHCETPKEYENSIRKILNNEFDAELMARNAVNMIRKNYNIHESFLQYSNRIYELIRMNRNY